VYSPLKPELQQKFAHLLFIRLILEPISSSSTRAVPRRARQNKTPKSQQVIPTVPVKRLWSILAQPWPRAEAVRPQDNRVHTFVQQLDLGTLFTTSTTVPTSGATGFTLSGSFSNASSYLALFDQYRIVRVETWVACPVNNSGGAGNWFSAVDYDSSPSLTVSGIQQYSNVLTSSITNGHYHDFRPHVAMAAYSGTFTSFANEVSPWIDSTSASVLHYGLVAVSEATPTMAENFNLTARLTVQFRNVL
jgi:hypothetical protein